VSEVVIIDGNGDGDSVISLNELEQVGKQLLADSPNAVKDRVVTVGPGHLASLIYTSGTTGRPKGVRLTHGAWTYTTAAIDSLDILGPDDLNFLWLPLAHAFGKVMLALPLQIGFPTAIDGRVERIVDTSRLCIPPSWVRRRASSKRRMPASSKWSPSRAGSARGSSTGR
jgi:long-chain acyl-CoA synthetase